MNHQRIAIAGFGVAGGALSVLLARAGHEVTVFERAPQPGPVGAGLLLQPSGQRVLSDMGLLDAVKSKSATLSGIEAFTHRGWKFSDLKIGRSVPGACSLGVRRGVLFSALHEAAVAAGARFCTGTEITGVRETDDGIVPLDARGEETGRFALLAACDGSRSALRSLVNPALRPLKPARWGALWGTGSCQSITDHLRQVAKGTRRLAGILPVGGGEATFFWGLHASELAPLKARGFDAFVEEAAAVFPAAAEILRGLHGFDDLTWATWHHRLPRHLYTGRLVLLGDAAHAMNPQLGHGASLALQDAASLARNLTDLPRYVRERRTPGRFFGRLSAWLEPFFLSRVPFAATLRNAGLPILSAIPWFRRQMELTLAGEKNGFFRRLWGSAE